MLMFRAVGDKEYDQSISCPATSNGDTIVVDAAAVMATGYTSILQPATLRHWQAQSHAPWPPAATAHSPSGSIKWSPGVQIVVVALLWRPSGFLYPGVPDR